MTSNRIAVLGSLAIAAAVGLASPAAEAGDVPFAAPGSSHPAWTHRSPVIEFPRRYHPFKPYMRSYYWAYRPIHASGYGPGGHPYASIGHATVVRTQDPFVPVVAGTVLVPRSTAFAPQRRARPSGYMGRWTRAPR